MILTQRLTDEAPGSDIVCCNTAGFYKREFQTPQSVEDCLQSALSSLYPPFEVTAPTLLSQVFSVLERTYREDPLRYTLEFLIPAKRILQNVQHQACSQYSGFLFFHEGWPLCLGDKILIQLSSLPWHFLKPGDFYLQVVPYLECSPRLVLKCLSQDGSGVQEIVVPESSHSFIFSAEWLNSINKDRSSVRLENCLAAAEEKVLRLHWSEVIYPRFIHKEGFIVGRKCPLGPMLPPLECRSPGDGGITSVDLVDPKVSPQFSFSNVQQDLVSSPVTDSICGSVLDCMEGEYVELSPPNKSNNGKLDSYRDTWVNRAKTAPSRKGKKMGYQAWLHEKKPGKVGSLSTLKQRTQDTWKERLCTGASEDQSKSTVDSSNYWNADATECSNETDLLSEWRKGLDLLQRHDDCDIPSERQDWISSESPTWVSKNYSQEQRVESVGADRTEPITGCQEDDILSRTIEGFSLKINITDESHKLLSTENSVYITSDCGAVPGDDVQQASSIQCQNNTLKGNLRSLVGNCPVNFQLGSLNKALKDEEDTISVVSHAKESLLTKTDRTWADGQETSIIHGRLEESTTVGGTQLPSSEIRPHEDQEKQPTWSHITDTPQKTGRGRRKKRNKRGRGPLRTEANKGITKTSEPKTDAGKEVTETISKTKEDEERKPDIEKNDESQMEALPPPAVIHTVKVPCVELNVDADQPLSQNPLLPVSPSDGLKCLHKDVNWDLMESGFICLTGGQDRDKKALLVICPSKATATYNHSDIVQTVSYLHSLLRPELRDLGINLILDLRDCTTPNECLLQTLKDNKDSLSHFINCTLIVCDKENSATVPSDLLSSQVSVVLSSEITQFIDLEELPESFGGERPYVPSECVWGQRSLGNLYTLCTDVLKSLEDVIHDLETDSILDPEALISHHRDAMKKALSDERLQVLQRDGGTLVARLQKSSYLRFYDPAIFELYEKVDEALHRLVQLSNQKLQELEERLSPQDYFDRTLEDSMSLQDTSKHQYHVMEALEEKHSGEEGQSQTAEPENRRLEVGVRIRGLEVSSRELADRTCSPPRGHVLSRGDGRGPDAPWGGIPKPEGRRSPQRLLLDLLCSERSYVQCLRRSLEARRSCPASLALRGSLEQLLNFHTYFLRELQNCVSQPLTVSYCFLQHAEQLRLYSLYVKNRQKVELFLPAPSGSLKGRRRDQKEEEETWAILQRPLEQLEQYQRFLGDMMQECDQEDEHEQQSLHTARELVGSLVHHGKNLLAAEAIRGFEVDEKEHGRLLLKDVFTVLSGRKKSLRHVFLFQKLLLLSKLKTAEGGLETYGFKQVFKTADMGLTESAVEGDTRIELWFRRPKSRETLVLQAENSGVKECWTNEITKLLWDQGGLSKDHRTQDTVSIGSSHRSFLDIKAGFSAISERTVGALLTARGSRTRSSLAISSSEHSSPSPPSSLSFALTSGLSPRRLRSPGGVLLPDKINEEGVETFAGGPVCLKSISPIKEGERPKDLTIEGIFPSTSV
ncbi:rho guanine nucleotide exchange factor 40 isoform X1 [Pelobates cultripes]|uniref:Rho guanine nucleotide exchange factor 40 isoform X1 n=1 Tax=Pelobates cultripes TaxID=61616 RepID=A0AAD1W9N8_PELCU|nr:rho guanine nucleotide exchange factor 40 isoform X1 [Pelobates cultripes]